ncbi:nucleotide exchange factor GrpE [Facklamia sp. DSM 111018]|uniref:Protein GrpE n=2 Tax=Facklamia lactis TaxID=2749967 RepID=A0ABS0LP82_9LACT|nr:nucleotide exchange factor GrpE [Facklamia lactis]MBG9985305.1 nucleotide exchange factor GrpE [Facklamia lactis]
MDNQANEKIDAQEKNSDLNQKNVEEIEKETMDNAEELSPQEDHSDSIQEESSKVDELMHQMEELEDRNLRLQAEIANIQRSNLRERQESAKYRSQFLAKRLVDAMDNLERALQQEVKSEEAQAIHKGVEMVYEQILSAFKEENIEMINPINQPFDPNFHQAVTTQPAEDGQDTDIVINVLQKGYVLNDRIIRPAMVIVSA